VNECHNWLVAPFDLASDCRLSVCDNNRFCLCLVNDSSQQWYDTGITGSH
jgi:hypothetical protein